jgi:peroxiredoxin
MKRLLSFLSLIALLTFSQSAASFTRVSGRVLSSDGAPPRLGKVLLGHLVDGGIVTNFFFGKSLVQTEIQKDGRFELAVPEAGRYRLVITAVDHEFLGIPLVISDGDMAIGLTAQLAPLHVEPDAEIFLLGSWNHFSLAQETKMTKGADGAFYFEGRSDSATVSYLIHPSLRPQHLIQVINGTKADSLIPDGEWAYKSVVAVRDHHFKITFDPRKFSKAPATPDCRVTFDSLHTYLTDMFTVSDQYFRWNLANWVQYLRDHESSSSRPAQADDSSLRAELRAVMQDPRRDLRTRQIAAVCLMQPFKSSDMPRLSRYSTEVLATVPPTSGMWAAGGPDGFRGVAMREDGSFDEEILKDFARDNPERTIRGMAMAALVEAAMRQKDKVKQTTLYHEALAAYGNLPLVKSQLELFIPDELQNKKLRAGRKVPDFQFPTASGIVSSKGLQGTYYLLDFWAVWCSECVEEMPNLQKLYDAYKSQGFTILSVALDTREHVDAFQKKHMPFPWMNIVLNPGDRQAILDKFEVVGLPRPILVDPHGKILAIDFEAWGAELEKRLKRIFGGL